MPSLRPASSRTISCRLDDDEAAAVETVCARLGISRAQWLKALVSAALSENPPGSGGKPGRHSKSPLECPHPRARVIKGFCYACGKRP